ncbi:MAG: RNA polymerase sigma factor, partial [Candidatus Poribacteria bacterium]
MKQLPDDMLVRRVLAGEKEAFGPIVERYSDLVHATIYDVLGDWDAVDGVAQDTFLAAYRSLGSLLKRENVGAWLYRIARNRALSLVKTAAWHRRTVTSELPADGDPSDAAIATPPAQAKWERAADLRRLVEDGLASLPEELRAPVIMFYMRDIPAQAISETLGVPMRTLERRLQNARKRLRTFFEGRGLADDVAMALKLCVPAGIGSVELAHAVLRDVAGLPTPQSSRAAVRSPVAPVSAVVGGSMLVGAAVGILALIDATRTVGLPAS